MRRDVREAMADIRAIVTSTGGTLRNLDDVIAEIRFETADRLEAHGIALEWPVAAGPAGQVVDYATARHLISILREHVSNIIRHARASRVSVESIVTAGQLALRVSDDGIGVDQPGDWGNG